jgi:hypothetical protein
LKRHLVIDRDVLTRIRSLPWERRLDFWKAVGQLIDSYGRPHAHAGLGIRNLRPRLFEFRLRLDLRALVRDRGGDLYLTFLGTHDEVQREIRSGKSG